MKNVTRLPPCLDVCVVSMLENMQRQALPASVGENACTQSFARARRSVEKDPAVVRCVRLATLWVSCDSTIICHVREAMQLELRCMHRAGFI